MINLYGNILYMGYFNGNILNWDDLIMGCFEIKILLIGIF